MIEAEPGTAGRIYAFAPSPKDGSIIAEDTVHVSLGETAAVPTFLEIDEPVEGAELDTANPITVSGVGGGLPEGNVVVMALDANDTVLAEQATTLQGADVSTGGTGTWSAQLIVGAPAGAVGRIVALSPSPADDSIIASAVVNVKYGGESESGLEGTNWILTNTLPEAQITALFENGKVSGSAGCNTYFGSYTTSQSASKNTIEFGPLGTTRMMCPEEVMDQEQLYLSALDLATEYQVEENVLTLTVPGGSLQFEGETVP
jgi:heat shock protein HslJ